VSLIAQAPEVPCGSVHIISPVGFGVEKDDGDSRDRSHPRRNKIFLQRQRTICLIWQVLYTVILATFGFVFVQAGRGQIPWVALAQVPHFVWVSIATVLQLSITWMNRS
jgi:tryptophan-rich sensory protein